MAYVSRRTERGLMRTERGWLAVERETGFEDSGASPRETLRQRLVAGPFSGPGAKARAIQAAGTNQVIV